MLEVKELNQKYFYGTNAINGVSFALCDGEKLAVLSKTSGGKTSLIKCLAGLFPEESGSIILDGKDITKLKIKDRGVRLVYDDGGLIRKRNVKFNLTYPLKLRKIDKCERLKIAYKVAKEYGLEPFFNEPTYRLFTPEIIALALARLETRESPLTLIDDLFSLASGQERKELFAKYLPKLKKISGNVIFATDSVEEAFSFGDKIMVLSAGYVEQIGTPSELKYSPNSLSVDVLVNPNKNRKIVSVTDGLVDLYGVKIKLPSSYCSDEVFVSYDLIQGETGKEFRTEYEVYDGTNTCYFVNINGEKVLKTDNLNEFFVNPDTKTLKVFDRVNEKVLTFELI